MDLLIVEIVCPILLFICIVFLTKWLMQGGQFKKHTSAAGKVIIVTGSSSGIGAETARFLARRRAKVYMACIDMEECEQVRKSIIAETGNKQVYSLKLDLASLSSVKNFVENFKAREDRLDVLINNAGIMGCPYMLTKDGFEMQLGVNHMGHFLLTNLLLDLLKKSAPSRIVVVASMAHAWGVIKRDDLNSEKSYNKFTAYNQSKLANVLCVRVLAKRLEGTQVTVNALHPGCVTTDIILRNMKGPYTNNFFNFIMKVVLWPFMKTVKSGAQSTIYAALDPDLDNVTGKYFSDCKLKEVGKCAKDDELAAWMWDKSVEWTMKTDP